MNEEISIRKKRGTPGDGLSIVRPKTQKKGNGSGKNFFGGKGYLRKVYEKKILRASRST